MLTLSCMLTTLASCPQMELYSSAWGQEQIFYLSLYKAIEAL